MNWDKVTDRVHEVSLRWHLKISSCRWLCTVAIMFAFLWLAVHDKIPADDVVKLAWGIVGFYFGSKSVNGQHSVKPDPNDE